MPVDRDAALNGNLVLRTPNGQLTAYVVRPEPDVPRHVSHFVTCPNSAQHRKAKV
jgi:hypothetical protein